MRRGKEAVHVSQRPNVLKEKEKQKKEDITLTVGLKMC